MKTCPPRGRLELLLAERLSSAECDVLEQHLASCATCRENLHDLTTDASVLRWRHLRAQSRQVEGESGQAFLEKLAVATHSGSPADRIGAPATRHATPAVEQSLERCMNPQPAAVSGQARDAVELPRQGTEFAPTTSRLPVVPGYQLLRELGRGGMGVVYLARQQGLDRLVALKVILAGAHAGADDLTRFRSEAEAIARLNHPNIEQIYEIGKHDGRPYMALEYLAGGSLAEHLDGTPQPPRDAAELLETLARAVHAAHQVGIVHRDLKPSNVLLQKDESGERRAESQKQALSALRPKITDFGLAKRLDVKSGSGLTRTRDIVGSPSYMAPEQAGGTTREITRATDTYALGAILYELLTGRPPFRGETSTDTVLLVVNEQPVPPRRLQPKCPRDLETICLKCLHKEPRKRYASAEALADDLDCFLAGEPIQARPIPVWERGLMWAKRQPMVAAMLTLVLMTTATALASLLWGFVSASDRARKADSRAESDRQKAAAEQVRADSEKQAREMERELRRETEHALNEARVALAERLWLANDVAAAEQLLAECVPQPNQPDLRGWEWHYLNRLCHSELLTLEHRYWVWSVAYSPDGKLLASAAGEPSDYYLGPEGTGELKLWDAATGECLATLLGTDRPTASVKTVAFSPDGRWLLARDARGAWRVWELHPIPEGEGTIPPRLAVSGRAVAFLPDGNSLAAFGENGTLHYFDLTTGKCTRTVVTLFQPLPNQPIVAAFSADGRRLGIRAADYTTTHILDSVTGVRLCELPATPSLHIPVLSADGQWLLDFDRLWNLDRREDCGSLGTTMWSNALFSPDGSWLARLTGAHATLHHGQSVEVIHRLRGHSGLINDLVFSPDSQLLATAGTDQTVRVWRIPSGQEWLILRGHRSGVRKLAFSPDGRKLASAGQDNTVRVWDLTRDPRGILVSNDDSYGEFNGNLAFAADGRGLLSVRHLKYPRLQRRDSATGVVLNTHDGDLQAGLAMHIGDTAFTADGCWLVAPSGSDPTTLKVWETGTGTELRTMRGHTMPVYCVALSWDAKRLASMAYPALPDQAGRLVGTGPRSSDDNGGSLSSELIVWDAHTGEAVLTFRAPPARCLALSSDGQLIAAGGFDNQVRLWEAATGRERFVTAAQPGPICSVAFSPDPGAPALAAAGSKGVTVWDIGTGLLRHNLASTTRLTCAAFSPDGRRLATIGLEGVVQLWDTTTGHHVFTLRGFAPWRPDAYSYLARVVFSPDGTRIAANNWNSSINVWDSGPASNSSVAALRPNE